MERQGVEMVRLEKAEEVYDVEEVLGRDASSVFPSLQAQLDPMEQLKAAMGAKRFVTETELEEIKAARGLNVDDGTAAADKPLAEVLAERKKAKQDAFDEQWKQMKTGKNRPLDADELEFYDSLAQQQAQQQLSARQEEEQELAAFRLAVAAAAEAKAAAAEAKAAAAAAAADSADGAGDAAAAGPGPGSGDAAELGRSGSGPGAAKPSVAKLYSKPAVPVLKPIVKVKPKGAAAAAQQGSSSSAAGQQSRAAAAAAGSPRSKKQRLDNAAQGQQQQRQQQQQNAGAGLAGLLGGYGSGSDDSGE